VCTRDVLLTHKYATHTMQMCATHTL